MKFHSTALVALAASFWSTVGSATVTTYTDEAAYLTALSAASSAQWSETFQGGVWDGLQTTRDTGGHPTYHVANSATSQGIIWTPPSFSSTITTEGRYNALPGETSADHAANAWSLTAVTRRNGDVDAFAGSSANTLYGVGGWFDSQSTYKIDYNDDGTQTYAGPQGHMFVSLDGGTFSRFGAGGDTDPLKLINGIGILGPGLPNVPRFFGIVDTAGFHSFNFSSDLGIPVNTGGFPGESSEPGFYAPIVYADNFTFGGAAAPVPEASTWAAMMAGLLVLGLRLKRRAASAS